MAQEKNVYGLKAVSSGPIAGDGGMGTVLAELLGATAKDTASIVETEATYEDVEIEEQPGTYRRIETAPAKWELKLSSYAVTAQKLAQLKGGTYTAAADGKGATWEAPAGTFLLENSVKAESMTGFNFEFPRMSLSVTAQFDLAKSKLGTLVVTGTALIPTKANTGIVKITEPAAA